MKKNNIFIILPFKESLNPKKAGAVSLFVTDSKKYSKFKKDIQIYSSEKLSGIFRNKNYILDFCIKTKTKKLILLKYTTDQNMLGLY